MPVFEPVVRTILILEDEPHWLQLLEDEAKGSLKSFQAENLIINLVILKANSVATAKQILDEYKAPIHIVSVDLNLREGDVAPVYNEVGKELFGGFKVLELFKNKASIGIVVSGEEQIRFPLQAIQDYGVLSYIVKTDVQKFRPTIETALWYLTALDSITQEPAYRSPRDIDLAKLAWDKALQASQRANIHSNQLPKQLNTLIQEHESLYTHPLTHLPMGEWTNSKLLRYIVRGHAWKEEVPAPPPELPKWTILRISLDGFSAFVNDFASQKQALTILFVRAINTVVQDYQEYIVFLGHMDIDITHSNLSLLLLLNTLEHKLLEAFCNEVEKLFKQSAQQIYPSPELHSDFDPKKYNLELNFKLWQSDDGTDFADLHIAIDELSRG